MGLKQYVKGRAAAYDGTSSPTAPCLSDGERLDVLAAAGGFLRGSADGKTAYRVLGQDSWHHDIRAAAAVAAATMSIPFD